MLEILQRTANMYTKNKNRRAKACLCPTSFIFTICICIFQNLWYFLGMNKIVLLSALVIMIAVTAYITCNVFETSFAEITIDWFAFLAGIFLAIEGIYKIYKSKTPFFPNQLLRTLRVIIGTCVFTIHLLQFIR